MLPDVVGRPPVLGKDHRPWWCARDSRRVGAVVGPSPANRADWGVQQNGARCFCVYSPKKEKMSFLLTTKRVANKLKKKMMASLI